MLYPEIEKLLEKVGKNKYRLVVVAARIAHQIEQDGQGGNQKPLSAALEKIKDMESETHNKGG